MAAPVAAVMSLQQPPQQRDEFASVFHAHAPHITSRSSSGGGHSRQSSRDGASSGSGSGASQQQLSEQQLFDRIEEQLEQLDKKRLMLQQLLRSLHSSPYSSRLSRSMESARVDAARLAKKIHNLFRFVSFDPAAGSADPAALKFQPLFQNYAAVSRILNATCIESIRFEEELAARGVGSGPASARSRAGSSADTPQSARLRRGPNVQHVAYDPAAEQQGGSLQSSPALGAQHPSQVQQLDTESLPLLQVHGLESLESSQRAGDYMHLSSMVLDIAESFRALQQVTQQQQGNIDSVQGNIDGTRDRTLAAESDLRKASRYKAFGLVMAGGVTGAAIGGPIGALVGLKTGLSVGVGIGLLGAGGALLGATAAKQIQKARFVPLSHLDEEHELMLMQQQDGRGQAAAGSASSSAAGSSSASSSSSSAAASSSTTARSSSKERASCTRKCI